ncbi:MAG: hypothetical protein IT297_04475 [Anaerolineae bacterium]|jgi:L-alanine-DL-glutamate epimerase-like enolase superfamily enzyme|nr:hypothetical protein [Anaerolineae bacterium]MCZ7553575.1 hypothetical protein [Anaerolineales bacterium]
MIGGNYTLVGAGDRCRALRPRAQRQTGGLHCARQADAIARAARLATMVGCLIEPALLIAAGLNCALASPNVQYGDLDGHLGLLDDPSRPGFTLQDGWLSAADAPGLGYSVELG